MRIWTVLAIILGSCFSIGCSKETKPYMLENLRLEIDVRTRVYQFRDGELWRFRKTRDQHALMFAKRAPGEDDTLAISNLVNGILNRRWKDRYESGGKKGPPFSRLHCSFRIYGEQEGVLLQVFGDYPSLPTEFQNWFKTFEGILGDEPETESDNYLIVHPLQLNAFPGQTWAEYYLEAGKVPTTISIDPSSPLHTYFSEPGYFVNVPRPILEEFRETLPGSFRKPEFVKWDEEYFEVMIRLHEDSPRDQKEEQ